jgi:hypothetical protein
MAFRSSPPADSMTSLLERTATGWTAANGRTRGCLLSIFSGSRAVGHDQKKKTQTLWETAVANDDTATMLTVLKQRYPETWREEDLGEAQGAVPLVVPDNAMPDGRDLADGTGEDNE